MEWHPWSEFEGEAPVTVNVEEPPCKHCKHWNPRIVTDAKGDFARVRFCIADSMYFDFSCFKKKDSGKG